MENYNITFQSTEGEITGVAVSDKNEESAKSLAYEKVYLQSLDKLCIDACDYKITNIKKV